MNHEFTESVESEPVVGGARNRGALVSKFILDKHGNVLSGERAYDTVYEENTLVGPAAEVGNSTRGFSRFCSAFFAGRAAGFDRPIFITNEESTGPGTFDGKGGQTVAIFDNEAHALPRLGHFAKENTVVMPDTGRRTVMLSLEDGPSSPDSQLYMYVGWKVRRHSASALARNGLDNGSLYVFASFGPKDNEASLPSGSVAGRWVKIPHAASLTDEELESAADAAGAFGFVRIEDGAFSKTDNRDFFFVTTGDNAAAGNGLGRLYHLKLNPHSPTKPAELKVVYNADDIVAAGGDIALSPDNIDVSKDYLMIQEDGTTASRAVMTAKGRDGGVWRFDLKRRWRKHGWHGQTRVDVSSASFIAELDPPGGDGAAVLPGRWESSGIIDASRLFGEDTWLLDVQAHAPTAAPLANTVEDGQLLMLTPAD
jgi:hypothetical protein